MGLFDWLKSPEQTRPDETQIARPLTADEIEAALAKAERMVAQENAPTPVIARVLRITTITRAIVPRLSNLGLESHDGYTVIATATNYLPESLSGYFSLPRDWADTRPVANGKSSLLLLVDQLDLLNLTISRMYDAVNRLDAEALVAQGQFLETKFARKSQHRLIKPTVKKSSSNPLELD